MSSGKVIKSVGFNVKNSEDVKILDAVKRRNFSRYVKQLILADIKGGGEIKTAHKENVGELERAERKPETTAERLARLKNLSNKRIDD